MKFTLSWLKDHLETDADAATVADALTRGGLEVEEVRDPGAPLRPFRVARVLTAERHPQADKLQVLSVDAGDGPMQVVCGAPNARAGMLGVFGPPGAYVPGSGITLKVAAIRGVESRGMMCSTRELELGEDHDGIIELPADAPVGASYPDYAGLTDPVFDVNVLPNRPDCMGVRGIARDLAAMGLGTLRLFHVEHLVGQGAGPVVATETPACPAFYARTVSGVRNGDAPEWMRRRLAAIGQKPISALVDVTNYVSVDLGRPLHVYDAGKLRGPLMAREAREGEEVAALNGRTYTLPAGATVIADEAGAQDIAGIMGGEATGATPATTDVLIECAYFEREAIARTGQALNLTSDARQRFERGVDPGFLDDGIEHATRLIFDICGGRPSEVTRAGAPPTARATVAYDPALCARLGGLDVHPDRQRVILASLGFTVSDDWTVTAPGWRPDIDGPADLVEEVIRIEGVDRVPPVELPRAPGVAKPTASPAQRVERRLRRAAAARGLDEAITWSFVSGPQADAFGGAAWVVANPISEELRAMRPSLLPGLLAAASRAQKRGEAGSRLFEIGRRYGADAERPTLGLVLAGEAHARGWRNGRATGFDAFDAKSEALALLVAAGAPVDNLQVFADAGPAWHPGRSGTLRLGPKTVLAAFGALHPLTLKAFDLEGEAVAAELYLDAIPARKGTATQRVPYAPTALQPVRRDFAFTVPAGLTADALVRAVKGADKAAIRSARLFDLFERDGVRSMAVEVVLQPPGERSFTEEELKAVSDRVVAAAAKQGATLRG